jgi:hypothetical protein
LLLEEYIVGVCRRGGGVGIVVRVETCLLRISERFWFIVLTKRYSFSLLSDGWCLFKAKLFFILKKETSLLGKIELVGNIILVALRWQLLKH